MEQPQKLGGNENRCFILNITNYNGIWQGQNPFVEALPIFITQLAAILIVTRFFHHLFKPLHQPRIVSDILGGILLGPSALGKIVYFSDLFPKRNVITVETLAYMALFLHMFLVGLELDLTAVCRISKKAIILTISGLLFPFIVGVAFFYSLLESFDQYRIQVHNIGCGFLWAASLTVTSFPAIGRILCDLKLLNSEIGRLTMPIALISDLGSWILVVILIPFCDNPANALYVILVTIVYVVASFYLIRPFLGWMVHFTSDGNNNYTDCYLCFALVGVVLSAFTTDVTGTHPIVGSFVFGLIMPSDIALVLLDRFSYFISGLLMPVFFTVAGLRVDIFKITKWNLVFVVVPLLFAVKILSFLPISLFTNIHSKDSFALGLLMTTKGIWAILVCITALDKGVLHAGDYAVTVISILLMNSIIAPTIATLYKRTNLFIKYNSRTIQEARNKTELRILVCIHSYCNVPGILKLLEISHGSGHNQMTVFALHFVDLPDQPSSVLIVHDSHSPRFEETKANGGHHDYDSSETDQIVTAFNEFEKTNDNVRVQSLTTLSPITAMHGDICSLAEDKFVALLILPFHKHATKEQCLEEIISSFPNINQDVLDNAPCSVGIFIDRGFEVTNGSDPDYGVHEIAMVFIGGADDCEALSYAWRMARKPGVLLTVIRLLETDSRDQRKSNELDDDCINEFRIQTSNDEFIVYEEKILNDGEELIEALKEMENKFELFIVGRRDGVDSPITSELLDRIDYLELGIIGDLLAASDSATSSILVVKQFVNLIDNKVIEDLIGTQWLSMDRSAMNFGSRRLLMATSNTLWMYSEQKLKEMHGVDEGDVDDGDGDGNGVNP
ncbi:hypothetical protein ES319_A06G212900v1 [Gossypium barbadense]|uniref:Uncharacterized protein n=2 Tax=Gossypium TaxID=3633 RepID=A0A5J5VHA8_GOSBA|nr:hypothetical protein ES319_A06G212900v1 [Gossypium barbadense]TYH14684.1 hypothetical protein ES288_A06G240000v1 [Gossypium darwinii]